MLQGESFTIQNPLPAFTTVGAYPLYYVTKADSVLCPSCAQKTRVRVNEAVVEEGYENAVTLNEDILTAAEINEDDELLSCDGCEGVIPAAYGSDEEEDEDIFTEEDTEGDNLTVTGYYDPEEDIDAVEDEQDW